MSMPGNKKKARQMWKSGRASVYEDGGSIPQSDWERMCRGLPWLFAAAGTLWLIWEAVA